MKFSESVKPISYLKTHASEVIRDVAENQKTLLITHNGEAKVVIQDVKVYEQTQEALALLKILAMNSKDIKKGRSNTIDKTFKDLRKKIEDFENHKDAVQS
jgi:prevent-host-death family protein